MRADVVDEAHVEHAIGLVEDEDLDGIELHVALLHEVEQATGRRDEDVRLAAERLLLPALTDAAVDDGVRQAEVLAVRPRALGDLRGELARRREDERADAAVLRLGGRRCRIGRTNAAVLPVPVWAQPRTSRPSSTCGMQRCWTGVGVV